MCIARWRDGAVFPLEFELAGLLSFEGLHGSHWSLQEDAWESMLFWSQYAGRPSVVTVPWE